jgi:hypothetical protein
VLAVKIDACLRALQFRGNPDIYPDSMEAWR